jgi:DNA-directed RNA polymerase subunit beta'
MVDDAIPEDLRDDSRVFGAKESIAFFTELANKHPEKYVDTLYKLNNIARKVNTEYGRQASLSLNDLRIPPRQKAYREELRRRIDVISQADDLTMHQKSEKIVKLLQSAMPKINENLITELSSRNNAFALGVKQGFRGSPKEVSQIVFGNVLVGDQKGRPVPIPALTGYSEGISPVEYWADAYGSRAAFSGVQFATADTGFYGKQLALMAHKLRIVAEDCGATDVGVIAEGDDPEIIGSVLARSVAGLSPGTVIEKKHLPTLTKKKPLVRSVITCQLPDGICQRCAGKRGESFPEIGAYVGIDSARVVAEPLVQILGLASKHAGVSGEEREDLTPFENLNQFLQVPKSFRGAAALSPEDGKVMQIVKAPQGGHYLHVNQTQVYVPTEHEVTVKVGDTVEAGDTLSSGTPNPASIAAYKGLGEGRRYFTDKFYDMLKTYRVPTHRKNVEILARSFFDRVAITNPRGVLGYSIGETIPYSELQRDYTPRREALTIRPSRAVGKYLEKPVLHYTIGTRITPKVAAMLEREDIPEIIVHPENPGFEPEVIRLMDLPASEPDWKVRLAGFGLKKSFLDSATKGSTSVHKGTSYVPSTMQPELL